MRLDINKERESRLWDDHRKTPSDWTRNQLIEMYLPFVEIVAKQMLPKLDLHDLDLGDLVSFGVFGLIDAIGKYDREKMSSFTTYAKYRVRGAIIDGIREMDWVPKSAPEDARIKMIPATVVSWVNELGERTDVVTLKMDRRTSEPDLAMHREDLRKTVLRNMSDKEKEILDRYYFREETMRAIGEEMGLSVSRVSQSLKYLNELIRDRFFGKDLHYAWCNDG